ncbi:multiubiquitin domain-containing protein [Sphingobacterium cellulitidis]|uniref:multiubiquitin domain-containing protein n=1 Tax=Sphingobacterium cellulitidis TaxID=1768011 RepID=UPI00370DCF52
MINSTENQNDHGKGHDKDKKKVTIIVNGTPHEVEKDDMTFTEVVTLAFPNYPQHPERSYSVKYVRGQGNKPEGILTNGGTVKVKDGMEFTVSETGQS